MRALIGIDSLIPLFLGLGFAQDSSATPESMQRNPSTKGSNGEPAVLPGVLIVISGLLRKETELYAKGAFAVDSLIPGIYQIEANAPGFDLTSVGSAHQIFVPDSESSITVEAGCRQPSTVATPSARMPSPSIETVLCFQPIRTPQPLTPLWHVDCPLVTRWGCKAMTPQSSQRTGTHIQSEAINGDQDLLAPSIEVGVGQLRRESRTKWDGESSAFDAVLYGNSQLINSATLQSHKKLNAALAVSVSTDASSSGPGEMNVTAATSATSTQLTRFRAMNRASSRKVCRHA